MITILVGRDGFGASLAPADERDVDGAVLGSFVAGDCLMTATGTVRCQLFYRTTFPQPPSGIPIGPTFFVTLTGRLHGDGGSGRAEAPIFPSPYFLGGDWTTESVSTVSAQH